MAKVHFNVSIDMRSFTGYDFTTIFGNGGHGTTTTTSNDWYFDSGYYEFLTGTGFNTGGVFVDQGTVTGWEFGVVQTSVDPSDPWHPVTQNFDFWNFTDLSAPGQDFSNAIESDATTLANYMPTLLAGADTIFGSNYADYLLGYDGNDVLFGNAGADTLDGGAGNDNLNGGTGADTMIGGTGNDTYVVDNIGDKVVEVADSGTDLVKTSVSYTLPANVENMLLTGTASINGNGNTLDNLITGNSGDNQLSGGGGNDTIHAGPGNDTLNGGSGNDTLYGGSGQDQFLFNTTLNAATNVDKIKDFSVTDDTIALDQTVFSHISTLGTLDPNAFYTGTSAQDSDDRIIYDSTTGNIYYDPDGNGSSAQVLFAHVTPGLALTNADFLIVA